jgi:hypothetical protein
VSAREVALAGHARRELAALDRRGFLRALGIAAAAGLLPAACRRAPAGTRAPEGLRYLTPRGYAVLNAAAARLAGPPAAELLARGEVDPALHAERFLAGAPALAAPLGQALLVLELGIWPALGKLRPFTALASAEQDAILAELAGSRFATKRRIFGGVRSVALLGFYAAPEARATTGYPIGAAEPGATIADAMAWDEGEGADRV